MNQNTVIYVALDIASSEKPAGMENFEETGYSFKFYREQFQILPEYENL